ncbi:MAG: type I restriction enzyme HsdR N-terminal domain-containing protein, partial [Candidatus Brocadiales bacterium]|nr:type I restriction enzyme HsdR N-terminal domain-containing protein [Candidatus Brocadiales bacterium]
QARDEGLNEADTVLRLCKFFEEVLDYDGLQDISRESQLKHKYVDICLKIDGRVRLLVEAKAANQQLRDRHIEQAQNYAAQNNYRWVILTNGVDWHLYRLTFDEGIEYERAFMVSLADDEHFEEAAQKLAILHKQSINKGELETFWEKTAALDSSSIGKVLFSEDVLMRIRREIRRETGLLIDPEDLAKSIHEMLSTEAREKLGPMRIRKRRRATRKEVIDKTVKTETPEEPTTSNKNTSS